MIRPALVLLLVTWLMAIPHRGEGFSVTRYPVPSSELIIPELMIRAERWSAAPGETGLDGGLEVSVSSAIPAALGVEDPVLQERLLEALVEAFREWENEALVFDFQWDRGPSPYAVYGGEIAVLLIAQGERRCPSPGACAEVRAVRSQNRVLTSGEASYGWMIYDATVMIVTNYFPGLLEPDNFDAGIEFFRQAVAHEVGHAIGMGHPDSSWTPNLDTDDDPLNEMMIDPDDPYAGLKASPNFDCAAVMMGITGRCGFATPGEPMLHLDDIAGRDALYPVTDWIRLPEPHAALQGLAALAILVALRRSRRTA